jgi:predicted ATPase
MNRAASGPEEIRRERAQQERYWLAEMERLGAELVHARHADRRLVTDQALTRKRISLKRG